MKQYKKIFKEAEQIISQEDLYKVIDKKILDIKKLIIFTKKTGIEDIKKENVKDFIIEYIQNQITDMDI